jgi:hypothetical protein
LGIVRRNVYHNDRGGYVSSRHVCLWPPIKKNRTRSLTLVRLAVNLGFAGTGFRRSDHHEYGLRRIILGRWKFLYHIDSDFTVLVKERKKSADLKTAESETEIPVSVFKDKIFWIFLFVCFITAVLFFQLFTTLPLSQRKFG